MAKRSAPPTQRPRHTLGALAACAGTSLISLGDVEQLAGINIKSRTERQALWERFRHLYAAPSQVLIDAVMDYCSEIALRRIAAGELCLIRTNWGIGRGSAT